MLTKHARLSAAAARGRNVSLLSLFTGLLVLSANTLLAQTPDRGAAEPPAATDKLEKEETWQVIYLSGQRIGYTHTTIVPIEEGGKTVVRTSNITHMSIKRFGQSLVMKQTLITEETLDGDLLKFSYESANPPASSTSTTGTVQGVELKLKQTVNGKLKETSQAWRKDVKSPAFQDRALRSSPLKPGESRSFEAFMPEFNKVASIKLDATDFEETGMLDGKKKRLLNVKMTQSLIPGLVLNGFVDARGDTLKTATSMLGAEMATYQVTQDEALKAISGEELDLAVGTLVKVKRIPNPHTTKKIRYRVTIKGQNPETVLPSGETQAVKKLDDEVAEVTVTALPIPQTATIQPGEKEFLASTQYLQSDDDRVKEHANKAAGDAKDPAQIAGRMEKYVHEKLAKKNFSTAMASAGEVARTLEGDCTEHAVLLAAMLRAKGIPSRVVVGLVYVDSLSAFGGHMWTEANLDGHWIPLDATLGRGGIGAAHLKLSESSLSDDGPSALSSFAPLMLVIGQLKIDVLE
jgi:hypothetical protein